MIGRLLNTLNIRQYRDLVEKSDGKIPKSLFRQYAEVIKARICGFTAEDYYVLGLYHGKNWNKMGSIRYNRVNRFLNKRVTGTIEFNKWIFVNYMKMLQIPVPDTYGFFHPNNGIFADLSDFKTRAHLFDFLHRRSSSFVVKPVNGGKGRNVVVIDKIIPEKQILIRANQQTLSFDDFYDLLASHDITWLFQEKVIQTREYALFNPSSVNTIRLNTIITDDHDFIVLSGVFRMGTINSEIDNLSSGGIAALINTQNGILHDARTTYSQHTFAFHPDSGIPISGFALPRWDEVRVASIKAHRALPFARYLGWDIAVTDSGPVFLEMNSFGAVNFYEKYDVMNYMNLDIGKIYLNSVEK